MKVIVRRAAVILFLIGFVGLGLSTEFQFSATHPLLADFSVFLRVFADASQASDPYAIRAIGPGFLNPPPTLLLVAPFAHLTFPATRAAAFLALNLAFLAVLLRG